MGRLLRVFAKIKRYSIYLIIGIITNIISLYLFILCFEFLSLPSLNSQYISSSVATFINFLLNKFYTFKSSKSTINIKIIFKYLIGWIISFIIIRLIFSFFYYKANLDSTFSYLLALFTSSIFFFNWQKKIVF